MNASPAELVVIFKADTSSSAQAVVQEQARAGRLEGITLRSLSSHAAMALERFSRDGETDLQRTNRIEKSHYLSGIVQNRNVESALDELRSLPDVETAYWKPGVENPLAPPSMPDVLERADPSVRLSDFRSLQGYLDAAPGGIDIATAWARPGGTGIGTRVIDIEGGWQLSHIDLLANSGGLLAGTPYSERGWRDHGTAVLGEMGGDANGAGVIGICPDAILSCVSHGGMGSSRAIERAAGMLSAGDVLLLEMHRPGPRFGFASRDDQRGYIAVEWWPDDFLAIQGATAKGIIVIEAAGNGTEDFDDPFYDSPGPDFLIAWRNPLAGAIDSGAILVGAGAPPNGRFGPDRSRLDFSNWGHRVDCQAWGRSVLTTGYGDFFSDAQDPHDEDYWYTSAFSGTSSASPIVAGVAACLQGIARAQGRVLHPLELRDALRLTGSPQVQLPGTFERQNIGTRPDLNALLERLGL